MICKQFNKPILFLMFPHYDRVTPDFSNSWSASAYDGIRTSHNDGTLFPYSFKDIADKYKSYKGKVNLKAKLYFTSTSKFPRFKLTDTDYKRCIKLEKADTIVMNMFESWEFDNFEVVLYETSDVIYCTVKNACKYWKNKWQDEFNKIGVEAYLSKYKLKDPACTKCYEGPAVITSLKNTVCVEELMEDLYSNIVTDDDLDKMININFDKLTSDDVKAITDMLDSTDKSVQALGLKMLCGYNINETPVTVKALLGFREHLGKLPEWKGVGVQQILKSIRWPGFMSFPHGTQYLIDSNTSASEYDKSLIAEVLENKLRNYLEKYVKEIEGYKWVPQFGISVNVDVKRNNSN